MIVCLCGCSEVEHAIGEGICQCGCPALRPFRPYGAEDELHDRRHDGIAEAFIQVHSLTVQVTGDHVCVMLPEPSALVDPNPVSAPPPL